MSDPGILTRNFEDLNPNGTYKYGLITNGAGEITNGTDVFEAVLADTPPGGTIRWQTTWHHTRPVQISKRVNLDGAISAPILVNMPDPTNDIALLVKGTGVPHEGNTYLLGPAYFTHRFTMLGGNDPDWDTPVCLHGVEYYFCSQARVVAHVRLPCTGWGVVSSGNLYGKFELTMSTNHPYYNHNGTQLGTGMPYRGLWARKVPNLVSPTGATVGESGNNNTHFHLNFAGARVLLDDGIAQSNLELSGSIESAYGATLSGDDRGLILRGLTMPHIHDLHYESNKGALRVESCHAPRLENVTLWGGQADVPGMVLDLASSYNTTLDNVQANEIIIRETCARTQVGSVTYGIGTQGGALKDYSTSTRFLVAPNRASSQRSGATGAGEGTGRNLIANGNFASLLTYTAVGTAPETVSRTRTDAARYRHAHAYRLTSTAAWPSKRMIQVDIPGVDQLGNPAELTFWAWVKWVGTAPTGNHDFLVGVLDTADGLSLYGGQLFPDAPGWVRIATRATVSGIPKFLIGGHGPFDVYVGEIGATFGQIAPAGWIPSVSG